MSRSKFTVTLALGMGAIPVGAALGQGWVEFQNETGSRLAAAANLGSGDTEEKDYAWADLDQDGDVDLVIVRKQPYTTSGGRPNVLLMNEDGVLVDRTLEFATAASDGGQGFLDITADRDVAIGDINNDGWLDVVVAPVLSQSLPKTKSHPRIYLNLGDDASGNWQGLYYDEPRIPQLSQAPNACGLAIGDVTGDGWADIYVVDYLSNLEDRLLVNLGNGHFADQTTSRMSSQMIESGFGTSGHMVDINGDGVLDIVKNEAGVCDLNINDPANPGFFNKYKTASTGSHYHVGVGDLTNDGKIDIILSDDGNDRYLINTGNAADGTPTFLSKTYSFQSGGDPGIAGNNHVADLNNDGWNDVLTADVDVDIPSCSRRLHLYRNLGNAPNVTLQDQGTGGIATSMLVGTFDVAPMDINGDGWLDLVIGRCSGTQVWIQVPPGGLVFAYPQGLPDLVVPDTPTTFQILFKPFGVSEVIAGSETIHIAPRGGSFSELPLTPVGDGLYEATLPATACTGRIDFYLSADLSNGTTATDPAGAPGAFYTALSAVGSEVAFEDTMEAGPAGWTTSAGAGLLAGAWELAVPVPSVLAGKIAAPDQDSTSGDATHAWVTKNGVAGQSAGVADVDGGPAMLLSPTLDLSGQDALITYARWMFCDDAGLVGADFLVVEVTNDAGATWTVVEQVGSTGSDWVNSTFRVSDFVAPTADVQVRFSVSDLPNNSTTEAGVDDFIVEVTLCPEACPADLDGSGSVDGADMGMLLATWGGTGPADFDGSGVIDGADMGSLLAQWGACP